MSGIKVSPLSEAQIKRLRSYRSSKYSPYVIASASQGNCILPRTYEKYAEKIFNFGVREDDVFIHGWMKTGTNWTQELVWSVMNYEGIDMAKKIPVYERVPLLESDMAKEMLPGAYKGEAIENLMKFELMKSPRMFKTHLRYDLLPPSLLDKCKVVACLRNPKDTFVSLYHYIQIYTRDGLGGSFEGLFDLFIDDLVPYAPYWEAILEQWNNRNHPNMCLIFYEDMKRDFAGSVRKVAEFFQKDLPDSAIEDLVERLSFKKMKEDAQQVKGEGRGFDVIHHVYRKGEIGDWKNHFTNEMNEKMDDKIAEKFKDTGLKFTYE